MKPTRIKNVTLPASKRVKAALCQLNSDANPPANIARCEQLIGDAAAAGAQLICLPELFNCLCTDPAAKLAAAEFPGRGPTHEFLAAQAAIHGIYLAGGSFAVRGRKKLRNRSLLYGPDGKLIAKYDKIHLFHFQAPDRLYDESELYEPGKQVICHDTILGKIGLSICYDLRFPELYRKLKSPDIVLAPSALPGKPARPTGKFCSVPAQSKINVTYWLALNVVNTQTVCAAGVIRWW